MFDFLSNKFSSIFSTLSGAGSLTQKNVDSSLTQIKQALLEADVPYELVITFIEEIKTEAIGQKLIGSLKPTEQLVGFFGRKQSFASSFQIPSFIMVMGLQGAGKTTTVSKLVHWVQKEAKKRGKTRKILCASIDFYRPAAIDQLEILAKQVDANFYRAASNDPVAAAKEIHYEFKAQGYELLFLDTAGRMHVDSHMLEELRRVDKYLCPKYKLLVLDAMTGQESLSVAKAFESNVGFGGAILSKMDSDTRGGAAFAFRYALQKPIWFIGTGEKCDDFALFHPERAAGRMLGMGDMQSLIERAQEKIKQADQDKMNKSLVSGRMTLDDFASQLGMINKLGSLSQLSKYMPGSAGTQLPADAMEKGEHEIKQFRAIMSSMTQKERLNPRILNGQRKNRIAKGAGVTPTQVNLLLQRFEQMQQYAKLFKKMGSFKGMFGP